MITLFCNTVSRIKQNFSQQKVTSKSNITPRATGRLKNGKEKKERKTWKLATNYIAQHLFFQA